MTAVPDDRLLDLLVEAIDLVGTERDSFLRTTCGDDAALRDKLGSLLSLEEEASDFLEQGAVIPTGLPTTLGSLSLGSMIAPGFGDDAADEDAAESGKRIGSYHVRKILGKGGMGVVYLAEQKAPVQRNVALKVIKLGMDTEEVIARFEAERQALALMSHPHIAKVFDAGATPDGRPYFVMEHVEGVPLTDYCDEHKLSIEKRLEIFVQTCRGVQHAHDKGILHRDIKPSNVLVTRPDQDPVVKIIDFGVAKATKQRLTEKTIYTEIGRAIGTPAYMSPEQAGTTEDDVDARTDVYSLGVFLYELLVGELPLDWEAIVKAAFDEIIRRVREEEPPAPSIRWSRLSTGRTAELAKLRSTNAAGVLRTLRGDLDWITMKALEKERSRRYATPAALADDVELYLASEPVSAGPPGQLYRLGKFVRKNRGPVSAVAIIIVLLTVGLAATTWLTFLWRGETENVRRLADRRLLQDYRQEAETLWPQIPEKVDDMMDWLRRADELAGRLPLHRATLSELRAHATGAPADADDWTFPDNTTQWHHDQLQELIRGLEDFVKGEASNTNVAGVRERLTFASSVKNRSIEVHRETWDLAVASIANPRECPVYGGLRLKPQLGLVPLGRNPEGLWEFAHLATGEPTRRGEDGRLILKEESGLVLILIPGGSFLMGAENSPGRRQGEPHFDPWAEPDEGPVQRVDLDPFFLSKYEMTQGQWLRLAGTNPSRFRAPLEIVNKRMTVLHPVESISWNDCQLWLPRLSLRLPTEAQWEYAARAGTRTVFWTGDESRTLHGAANVGDIALGKAKPEAPHDPTLNDGWVVHAPVGSFRPNGFGLHDVVGNVRELCVDAFAPYQEPARPGDGERSVASPTRRIARGGGWSYGPVQGRSADRGTFPPNDRPTDLGVRPARPVE